VNPDDLIDLVQHAYDVRTPERHWFETLAETVWRFFPQAIGVHSFAINFQNPAARKLTASYAAGDPVIATIGETVVAGVPPDPELDRRHWGNPPVATMAEMLRPERGLGPTRVPFDAHAAPAGIVDTVNVSQVFAPSEALSFVVVAKQPLCPPTTLLRDSLARAMAHAASAHRLRLQLADRNTELGAGADEAVLNADGLVEHADGLARSGRARKWLQDAAVSRESALRGRGQRLDALEAWRALVMGKWSLVDRFDRDGRRYLVAVPNEMATPDPRALSVRERQALALHAFGYSGKLIAYQLGLAPSTVSQILRRARRKLGLRSLNDVFALFESRAADKASF